MRLATLFPLAAVATSIAAHPHKQSHGPAAVYQPAPVATVIVYVLDGKPISEAEVRQGIANGTLIWGDGGNLSTSLASIPTPGPIPVKSETLQRLSQQPAPKPATQVELKSAPSHPQPSSAPQPYRPEPEPSQPPAPSHHNQNKGAEGVEREFPNGEFSCNSFPRGYGAVAIDHAGLGGWIGIQAPRIVEAAGYDDIMTVPHGSCSDGTCCKPGRFCSYSCPPGYLKASWPSAQVLQHQTLGGLYCNLEGKLEMASGSISKTLCVKGTDKVTVKVQNKLSASQSICRTDYPGTEGETIPTTTRPGESVELACPDNSKYFKWLGKPTSAQYYINPKGVPENEACQWGDGSRPIGNWAPVNLGAGYDDASGKAYIPLFPNAPTNPNGKLDFSVELVADDMNGRCKYSKGMYYYGNDYSESSPTKGCTIALNSGTLNVVLTDD
ncbi:SUN-domain-containing protein [Westerdykella ornata]|uniref:SUN-domain-containing protein n=1 Tax=Westerdykella ornata TaxID=318751 RepID=A0A6A6JR82_WESOR|nr:SUN-domain-containing protein [Westerdykella ornata]KAF2278775.1 SUN-domain-containing protein [Westerdykella ornata]